MRVNRAGSALAFMASFVAGALPAAAEPATASGDSVAHNAVAPVPRATRPNVLVWMLDDVGFAQLDCFGGLVQTPNIDRVARMGLRFTNFHSTPICSSSRAAFLTGRNAHSVHIGGHAAAQRPYPGWDGEIPASAGTIAANLREAGYLTFALGKWDHVPSKDMGPSGPFTYWPLKQGFDHFYGFMAADADNWNPVLIRDASPAAKPADPAYHLSKDLADNAITMIQARGGGERAAPFFMYWATGAAHTPHHAPREWMDRYRGKFDMGWDKAREEIFAAQKHSGLIPAAAELPPRPEGMPAWDSLSAEQKRLYAREMEAFAAALGYADEQFGRILDALEASGELDDTMVVILSDNGASAEGGLHGTYSENLGLSGRRGGVADNMEFLDGWGGPDSYPHYALGWAVAGNTPFKYYKQTTHEGGIHVPLVIAWPKGIAAHGETRDQFVHISDLAPTIMAMAEVPLAKTINNAPQSPMEGRSVAYSFDHPLQVDRDRAQYFEMYGNKGLWSQGWAIVTSHRTRPWEAPTTSVPNEAWELYDLSRDPGEVHDLAATNPQRVKQMSRLFDQQAQRFNVHPIGNISDTAPAQAQARKDDFARRSGRWVYAGPVARLAPVNAPPVTERSYRMTAKLDLPQTAVTGSIFAIGGALGGVGFYLADGRPSFVMRTLKGEVVAVTAPDPLPAGASAIEVDFSRPAAAPMTPLDCLITIRANGKVLVSRTVRYPMPASFGLSETFDIGSDDGSAVMPGLTAGAPLPATIGEVVFDFNAQGGPGG